MATKSDARGLLTELRELMLPFAQKLVLKSDTPTDLYVNTAHILKNKKPLFFGAVQSRKNYVSYHLMPVYVNPMLLEGISGGLRQRMPGKSCFNFKAIDRDLFAELAALTKAGYDYYVSEGYVE